MSTQAWGNEVSWKIIDTHGNTVCSSRDAGAYSDYTSHDPEICTIAPTQPTDKAAHNPYKLICEDTYGDGWHGGRLYIQGVCYCDDFTSGFTSGEVSLEIQGKSVCSIARDHK